MLKEMRSGAANFLAKLLLAFLCVVFVFWGVSGSMSFDGGSSVATVGKRSISQAEFVNEIRPLKEMFSQNLPDGRQGLDRLYRMRLNEMIVHRMIAQEAAHQNLLISEDVLAKQISNNPNFKSAAGDFDKIMFQQYLKRERMTERDYLEQMAMDMQQGLIIQLLGGSGIVPKGYAELLYRIQGETRVVDLLTVTSAGDFRPSEPSEQALKDYYAAHQGDYKAPEYRSLSYLAVKPQAILGQVQVGRDELFALYNQRRDTLMIPEKRDISQLLYATKAEAENAYGVLRMGKSMEQTATMVAPNNKAQLGLGFITKEQMPAGGDTVFSLAKSEFSQPIESPFGWHVFYVKDIHEQHVTPFEDVKNTLEAELKQTKGENMLTDSVRKLEDAVGGTSSLEEAAKEANLTLVTTAPLASDGRGMDGQTALSPLENADLLSNAFKLNASERSDLVHESAGGDFVVRVDKVIPSRQLTLEEVRPQAVAAWKAQDLQEARKRFADNLAAALNTSASPAEAQRLIASARVKTQKDVVLPRAQDPSAGAVSPALAQDVFSRDHAGQATAAHKLGNDGFQIAVVRQIVPAPDVSGNAKAQQQLQTIVRGLAKDYDNEVLAQYLEYLKARYPIMVNEGLLAQLIEQQ